MGKTTQITKGSAPRNWPKLCRWCLEWVHTMRNLDVEPWIRSVVERAQGLNIDTLAFDLYHGGYALFEGAVAPKDAHVGKADLLALLDREVHERGMCLVIMHMATHCCVYASENRPEWHQRDAQGNSKKWWWLNVPCLNSPWTNFFLQELSEVLSRYHIDGVYIEGINTHFGPCYCAFCKTAFRKTYGFEIPEDPAVVATSQEIVEFRARVTTEYVRRVGKVIREVSPDTVWIPSPSFYATPQLPTDFASWGLYTDGISLERQWGHNRYQIPLRDIGMSLRVVAAESGRPTFGVTFIGWEVDLDYSHCTASHYRLSFMEMLLYGATPQLHAQTIFDLDQSEMGVVREMYDFEEKLRPYLVDAQEVAYAGLVMEQADNPTEWFKGYYRALLEAHIPFKVVPARELRPDKKLDVKVLVLPNLVCLDDEQVEAVAAFVRGGGGLVLTYRTGFARPDGSLRKSPALLRLAGCEGPFQIVTNPPSTPPFTRPEQDNMLHYWRLTDGKAIAGRWEGRLQSFRGSYVAVEPTSGKTIAQVLDYDYSKSMHRHHPVLGWYPGRPISPLVILNEAGEAGGRVAYFTSEMDATSLREGMPGQLALLSEAVTWVGKGKLPLQVNCPPTVEIATHYSADPAAYTILLLNQTTNQLHPDWVVRNVEPISDIQLELEIGKAKVKEVVALNRGSLTWNQKEGRLAVALPRLDEYEAIVVKLAGKYSASARGPADRLRSAWVGETLGEEGSPVMESFAFEPEPDFARLRCALKRGQPDRVPVVEIWVNDPVAAAFLGRPIHSASDRVEFWLRAGYDYVPVPMVGYRWVPDRPPKEGYRITRSHRSCYSAEEQEAGWRSEHAGWITSLEEMDSHPWPRSEEIDLTFLRETLPHLPEKMRVVVITSLHELVVTILGTETFLVATAEEPQLVQETYRRVGELIVHLVEQASQHEKVGALWVGDDLAYTQGMFYSPEQMRAWLFPWYRKIAAVAQAHDLPLLFHSDGDVRSIIPDLVEIGFDALHPIEPKAMDIAAIKREWGDRLCLIGNIDLCYTLTRGTPEEVEAEVRQRLRQCGPGGGYCVSSANSIPEYVPLENYCAMLQAARRWGGYPLRA